MDKNNLYRKIYCTINSDCNNNCINCLLPENFKKNRRSLSLETLEELITGIEKRQHDIIEISGGEPTLHPQLIDILSFLRSHFWGKIVLLTNAEKLADYTLAKKISALVDDVVVTLYTSNKKIHDFITQTPNSLEDKISGLKNLSKLGVKLHIKTLLMKQTFKVILDLIKFCKSNFRNFHFNINSLHITNKAWENREMISVKFSDTVFYIQQALDYTENENIVTSVFAPMCLFDPYYWNHFPVGFGDIVRRSISITPDGRIGEAKMLLNEFIQKPSKCQECFLKDRCYWPWEGYIAFFGDEELSPINKPLNK